jgi:hypothetical protein
LERFDRLKVATFDGGLERRACTPGRRGVFNGLEETGAPFCAPTKLAGFRRTAMI